MSRSSYQKSILFDVARCAPDRKIKHVADGVLAETLCEYGHGYKLYPKAYNAALKNVVLNLIACHDHPFAEWVAYSRDRNTYTTGSRYNKLFISYRPLMKVIDAMCAHGFLTHVPGVNFPHFRMQSRMQPRLKFIELLYGNKAPKAERNIELIQLKGVGAQKGKYLEYADTADTERMRRRLEVINQGIQSACLGHSLTEEQHIKHIKALGRCLDYSKTGMHRVFNGSFDRGGRFYGPWWHESKKEYRPLATINGYRTIERDFSSLHPTMLYHLMNAPIPKGDLYTVPGFESRRDICKILFNSLLNAPTRDSAIKAAMSQYNIPRRPPHTIKKDEMSHLAELLILKHRPISDYLGSGVGLTLQYYDSCIAEEIMMSLLSVGIVSLPVHDSFIVAEQHEGELCEAMREEYREVFKKYPVIG